MVELLDTTALIRRTRNFCSENFISISEFGRLSGIHHHTAKKWLVGDRNVKPSTMQKISEFLNSRGF